jgi:transcriptional regulator with XRE-family HTH domain
MTFKEATDLLSMPLEEIASAIGKTYATVLAYRTGGRVPPPEVRVKLAKVMRERAAALLENAGRLDPPSTS